MTCFGLIITGCSQNKSTSNSSISSTTPNLPSSSSPSVAPEYKYFTYRFYDAYDVIIKEEKIKEGEPIIPPSTNPSKHKTDQYSYTFLKWSVDDFSSIHQDLDIYPIYSEIINQYTYTFLNYDDSEIKKTTADYGTLIVAPSNVSYDDSHHFYTFTGWDKEFNILTENITIKAVYDIVNAYTYTFYDAENNIIKSEKVVEGSAIIPPDIQPEKVEDSQYTYKFLKWSIDDFSSIHEDLNIYPIYENTVKQYTYTFLNYDNTELKSVLADYGTAIIPPENPTYSNNDENIYTFVGWDKEFNILTENITIKALYSVQTDVQLQAINIIRSAFENNQVITVDASLTGAAILDVQLQFSIEDQLLNQLLEQKVPELADILQAITLKGIIQYQEQTIMVEINPQDSYLSYLGKVYHFNLVKTYQTLLQVLPKEVFDIVAFLEQLLHYQIPVEALEVNKTEQEATIQVSISLPDDGTGIAKTFTCNAHFNKVATQFVFDQAVMTLYDETINIVQSQSEFQFEINYENALNWFDYFVDFANPISKTAQLKDFHITGKIELSGLGIAKVSITFDIKISLDENGKVYALLDLLLEPNVLGSTIVKAKTHSKLYIDGANNKIYLNQVIKDTTINKNSWTFETFSSNLVNNIFDILNASDTVRKNADTTATINYAELIQNVTASEARDSLTIVINKDAITLTNPNQAMAVSKNLTITLGTDANGYITTLNLDGAVSMNTSLSLTFSTNNTTLVDIGQKLNTQQLIQDALASGEITDII